MKCKECNGEVKDIEQEVFDQHEELCPRCYIKKYYMEYEDEMPVYDKDGVLEVRCKSICCYQCRFFVNDNGKDICYYLGKLISPVKKSCSEYEDVMPEADW